MVRIVMVEHRPAAADGREDYLAPVLPRNLAQSGHALHHTRPSPDSRPPARPLARRTSCHAVATAKHERSAQTGLCNAQPSNAK
eukprot:SAG11_NODE_2224_length_3666_cov_2.269975_4_plen_84_part_00